MRKTRTPHVFSLLSARLTGLRAKATRRIASGTWTLASKHKERNVVEALRCANPTQDNNHTNAARSPAVPHARAAVAPKALPAEHSLQSSQGYFLE